MLSVKASTSPTAPSVTANDTTNMILGADATMEYSIDGGTTWVSYDTNNEPNFIGDQTVLVRVSVIEGDPTGDVTTLNFTNDLVVTPSITPDPVATVTPSVTPDPVTPAAPRVTADDTSNKILGADATLEYSVDFGTTWVNYVTDNEPSFTGDQIVIIRVAASGVNPNGIITLLVFTDSAPVASMITLSGTAKLGNTITATYNYSDLDNDQQGNSILQWYRANDASGKNKSLIKGANSLTYQISKADQGKYIIFRVTPVAITGTTAGIAVSSSVKVAPNVKPVIVKITWNGKVKVGEKILANYVYQDADNDLQGTSIIKWYRADSANGKNKQLIAGANGLSLTLAQSYEGKFIICAITPVAKTGIITGNTFSVATTAIQKIAYKSHVKLGAVGSKSSATMISNTIKKNDVFSHVVIKKEGKNYRIYADFVDKTSSEKSMKLLKLKKYIRFYSYIK